MLSHLHLPAGRICGRSLSLRIINDPSEHNFSNYWCSVIMLMLIHKGLLFAQRVLCTLSLYLTNSVFPLPLWFACHVKWYLPPRACQDTRIRAEVLFPPPSQDFPVGFLMRMARKGAKVKTEAEERTPLTDVEIIVQRWSELHQGWWEQNCWPYLSDSRFGCWWLGKSREPAWSPPSVTWQQHLLVSEWSSAIPSLCFRLWES